MSYVYLLIDASGDHFKIGRSIAPLLRSTQLPQDFDLAASLQVPVLDWQAEKVESILHGLFRDQAVMMPPGSGYTEWFSIEAWDAVLAFLADHRERLGIGEPEPIPYLRSDTLTAGGLVKRVNFNLTDAEHLKLKVAAAKQGKSITQLLTDYVRSLRQAEA